MGMNSRCKRFPGGKDFLVGKISWWEGITGGEDFLVGRNYRCEGVPGGNEFPM